MTLICVPIMVEDEASALRDARLAAEFGADLIEFRVDSFFTGTPGETGERESAAVLRLIQACPLPVIITCRPAAGGEGGHYDGPEDARVSFFERLGTAESTATRHSPRYIDVELASYMRSANFKQKVNLAVLHPGQVRDLKTSLILSSHDFDGRPADLLRRLATMRDQPAASILKVAYRARSLRDNLELFDVMRETDRPMIALGMGEFGLMSRVLAPKFGGFLTFASLRPTSTTAPGQPTVDELLSRYRFRSIKHNTRVYGVIGWPVSQSISPDVHNAGFEAIGEWPDCDEADNELPGTHAGGVYLPLPVPPEYEHFKATLSALLEHPMLDFAGCSVTIPHKEHLVRFARESIARGTTYPFDDLGREWDMIDADDIGAANTLVVRRGTDGEVRRCEVLSTDGDAAVAVLEESVRPLVGLRVGLLGAGGAARSIAMELSRRGVATVIFNRTRERAEQLADAVNERAAANHLSARTPLAGQSIPASLDDVLAHPCDVLINCTPIGMATGPVPNDSAVSLGVLRRLVERGSKGQASPPGVHHLVVMDTVYSPVQTPLLRLAEEAGAMTIDGVEMFVKQAEGQVLAWTGAFAPKGLYREVALRRLAK